MNIQIFVALKITELSNCQFSHVNLTDVEYLREASLKIEGSEGTNTFEVEKIQPEASPTTCFTIHHTPPSREHH